MSDVPFMIEPIGTLKSEQKLHHEAPRQSGLARGADGVIVIRQGLQNALADLSGFSHLWVLFWCHLARGWKSKVQPPRDCQKRGLFATRAPQRPNPIGLSCVRLVAVRGRRLEIADHDLLDGTPILDLKPYLPYCDSVPQATIGYVADLPEGATDHVYWWTAEGREPPRIYRPRESGSAQCEGPDQGPADEVLRSDRPEDFPTSNGPV